MNLLDLSLGPDYIKPLLTLENFDIFFLILITSTESREVVNFQNLKKLTYYALKMQSLVSKCGI